MSNEQVPKQKEAVLTAIMPFYSTCFPFPFGTMPNELVPKPILSLCRILISPLEPCQMNWYQNYQSKTTDLLTPLEPCQTNRYQNSADLRPVFVLPLEPCQTNRYQNLALTNFWNQSIGKVGDAIPIVARKLLRTMKSSPHCLPESRIDTSHLSVQSEQPPN